MGNRTKGNIVKLFLVALFVCLIMLLLPLQSGVLAQETVNPYPYQSEVTVSDYDSSAKTITLSAVPPSETETYTYQFWLKKALKTDGESDLMQGVWTLARDFNVSKQATAVDISQAFKENGSYTVLCRIKAAEGEVVSETVKSFTGAELGDVEIGSLYAGGRTYAGRALHVKKTVSTIRAEINIDGTEVFLVHKGEIVDEAVSKDGYAVFEINLNESRYPSGRHGFTVQTESAASAKSLDLYLYEDFDADSRLYIVKTQSLNISEGDIRVIVTALPVSERDAVLDDIEKHNFSMRIGGSVYEPVSVGISGDKIEAVFEESLSGFGVYPVTVSLARKQINTYDDSVTFYHHYTRDAGISISIPQEVYNPELRVYDVPKQALQLTAVGYIKDQISGLPLVDAEYAFYREDASGWILIKDFSSESVLDWNPLYDGIYNIQVRIRSLTEGGSWEASATKSYRVGGTKTISAQLNVYNYNTETEAQGSLVYGVPYILKVDNNTGRNLFYRFTMHTPGRELVYLNSYSPSNMLEFYPDRPGTYVISARIIDTGSYGYTDITKTMTFTSGATPQISTPEELIVRQGIAAGLQQYVSNADTVTYNITDSAGNEIVYTDGDIDSFIPQTGGIYVAEITARSGGETAVKTVTVYAVDSDPSLMLALTPGQMGNFNVPASSDPNFRFEYNEGEIGRKTGVYMMGRNSTAGAGNNRVELTASATQQHTQNFRNYRTLKMDIYFTAKAFLFFDLGGYVYNNGDYGELSLYDTEGKYYSVDFRQFTEEYLNKWLTLELDISSYASIAGTDKNISIGLHNGADANNTTIYFTNLRVENPVDLNGYVYKEGDIIALPAHYSGEGIVYKLGLKGETADVVTNHLFTASQTGEYVYSVFDNGELISSSKFQVLTEADFGKVFDLASSAQNISKGIRFPLIGAFSSATIEFTDDEIDGVKGSYRFVKTDAANNWNTRVTYTTHYTNVYKNSFNTYSKFYADIFFTNETDLRYYIQGAPSGANKEFRLSNDTIKLYDADNNLVPHTALGSNLNRWLKAEISLEEINGNVGSPVIYFSLSSTLATELYIHNLRFDN